MNPGMSWLARMLFHEHRKTERQRAPQLAAYYWNGANAVPHSVRDISSTGAYIVTEERWHLGTILMVTLQSTDEYIDARPPPLDLRPVKGRSLGNRWRGRHVPLSQQGECFRPWG